MLTVTIERFLAFTKENIAGVVEWPLVRGCLYDTRMTFIPVRVSFQSEVGSTAKGARGKEKKHSKSEKVRTNNNYCSTMTLFHYHLNVLLIPYPKKKTILSIIPYPLNYLSSYPSSLKALTGCDVVCPLDTAAVTEIWRLDLFSCTSSSFLCAGTLSARGKCCFFFFLQEV